MKTRVLDLAAGYSFLYQEPGQRWRIVGGDIAPRTWPTAAARDAARACFTRRRSVRFALADLAALDGKVQP